MVIEGLEAARKPDPIGAANLHHCNAWTAVGRMEGAPCADTDGWIGYQLAVTTNAIDAERHGGQPPNARTASAGVGDDRIRGSANDVVNWRVVGPATFECFGGLAIENTACAEKDGNGRDAQPTYAE